jgi:hypothetical protein
VLDDAKVFGKAQVCEAARVYGEAQVFGEAWAWGDAPLPSIDDERKLAREILARLDDGGELKMNTWHTCETTHCLAGWAQTLRQKICGSREDQTYEAGVRLLPSLAQYFFADNKTALKALKKLVGG